MQPCLLGHFTQPAGIALVYQQQGEHIAQVVGVFVGRVEMFIQPRDEFVAKAFARENPRANQQGIKPQAAQPFCQQLGGFGAQLGVLLQGGDKQMDALLGALAFALAQPNRQALQQVERIVSGDLLGEKFG